MFFPGALLVDVAWIALYWRDRTLVRLLRARHPSVFTMLRGRPRRWYDPSEEVWVQQRTVRRELRRLLSPLVAGDPELGAVLAKVDVAELWFRRVVAVAVVLTIALVSALVVRYRLGGGP